MNIVAPQPAGDLLVALEPLGRHELRTPATEASGEPILLRAFLNAFQRRLIQRYEFALGRPLYDIVRGLLDQVLRIGRCAINVALSS